VSDKTPDGPPANGDDAGVLLAEALRRLVLAAERTSGVTKDALAKKLFIHKNSLYAYLNGTTVPPNGKFDDILDALNAPATERRRLWQLRDDAELAASRAVRRKSRATQRTPSVAHDGVTREAAARTDASGGAAPIGQSQDVTADLAEPVTTSVARKPRWMVFTAVLAAVVAAVGTAVIMLADRGGNQALPPPGLTPSATPTSPPFVPGRTYKETAAARVGANTFGNPHTLSGGGQKIPIWQDIEVTCKVLAATMPSVYYWYKIAGPDPWTGMYTPANSYLNGAPKDGPYNQDVTDVDKRVPDCPPGSTGA